MINIPISKEIVVKLNRLWQACGILTVKDAVTFLCKEEKGEYPGFVMDFETAVNENGESFLVYANAIPFDDWIKLPVRENDLAISTSSGAIRAPLVVICANYEKLPTKGTRWSVGNVWRRDKGICQVSGKQLSRANGNVGHLKARAHGGRDTFENTVLMDRHLNTLQGTKTPREMGWTLLRKPVAPASIPITIRKEDAPLPIQRPFLLD